MSSSGGNPPFTGSVEAVDVAIHDGAVTTQKLAITASGQAKVRLDDLNGAATDSKLDEIKAEIDGLEEALGTTADLDTASTVVGRLKKLVSLWEAEDFATQATLAALKTRADLLATEATLTSLNTKDFATQATLAALKTRADLLAEQSTLVAIKAKTDTLPNVRMRQENTAYLYHSALGVISVAALTWVTLASISVPANKTLRLVYAEGDLANLASINQSRAIRIRQGTTVKAVALTGSDQPNPDVEGLVCTSGASAETWDLQGRHGDALNAHDMVGWFTWVEVND